MRRLNRRRFLELTAAGACCTTWPVHSPKAVRPKPNVILLMSDDQGWGDVGFHGHPTLRTPNLDEMAGSGMRFERWYSAAPLCSPTRGSALTGRHPYRYGIFGANVGFMPEPEITLAEAVKTQGYRTGHFGKWHLGTLTTEIEDSNRGGPGSDAIYSPPWENGFDVCFSTESRVPTWNPMMTPGPESGPLRGQIPGESFHTYYWTGPGRREAENLEGDDSRIIMDRAIPFIRETAAQRIPFLAVIWLHSPHEPVVAGPEYRALYAEYPEDEQHYFGVLTAMDEQIGRLRRELRETAVADHTMLWFCSDNGPASREVSPRCLGSAGPFRGRKGDLFEGGIRVPGILEWPDRVSAGRITNFPACTSDYFPTILDVLGLKMQGQPQPVDGISLLALIEKDTMERPSPIAFEQGHKICLSGNRYKLISQSKTKREYMLFDLLDDPGEKQDLASRKPELVQRMGTTLEEWEASCDRSLKGADYR